jgi:hypothetical protein
MRPGGFDVHVGGCNMAVIVAFLELRYGLGIVGAAFF